MDTTEIFLSRKQSDEELYDEISKKLGFSENCRENLYDFLSGMTSCNAEIYISNEDIENPTIDSITEIFEKVSAENENFNFTVKIEEFLNIADKDEHVTGKVKPRSLVHRDGDLHITAHIWIIKRTDVGINLLLQKRSSEKKLYPDCYDVSAAGHILSGEEPRYSAVRELEEELGITVDARDLEYIGTHKSEDFLKEINIINREMAHIYIYTKPVDINSLKLQESEVSDVRWLDIDECLARIDDDEFQNCIEKTELEKIKKKIF